MESSPSLWRQFPENGGQRGAILNLHARARARALSLSIYLSIQAMPLRGQCPSHSSCAPLALSHCGLLTQVRSATSRELCKGKD